MEELAIEASVFTPMAMLSVGLIINGLGLFTLVGLVFGLQRKQGTMDTALAEFEADTRGDSRVIAEILRGFAQGATPRISELASIGLRRETEED